MRGVLARCLTKDAARRYHHLADARLDLEGRRDRTEREVSTSISFRDRLFAPLILGVILVASIAVWAVLRPDPSAPRRIQRFAISLPSGGGLESVGSAFSPDGSHLVFVGSVDDGTQLYVRPLNEVDAVPLRGTEGASQPFFSPDGKWVGFFAGRKLKKVPLAGGPALVIADVPGPPRGASWGPNDDIFCAWLGASGVFRVSSEVGNPESVTTTDREKGDGFHYWPKLMAVRVEAGSPLSTPIVLFEGRYQLSHTFRGADYDVTPDGRFVMTKPVEADSALQMHVVLNWFEELERLVPTNRQ